MEKLCNGCGETKPRTEFHPRRNRKIGIQNKCKACKAVQRKQHYEKHGEVEREQHRKWSKANKEVGAKHARERGRLVKQSTPNWLSEDHLWLIKEIYELCRLRTTITGVKHHVDHIYPIRSQYGCGLHVPWNLQVITQTENYEKGNKLPVSLQYLKKRYS
jgi:hypothetical protein